ncbi:hypothetical protein AX15_006978 [Amanita polypyramis BW_CC]|nr:hypothetical protein AX15_006978 [Amanita polypyramis BW_CC]
MANIALGISVGLVACCVQSLGLTVQRKSHVLNHALPPDIRRSEYRRPLWLFGFAIFLSANVVGSLVQIATLPVVILAPLGAVSLLWNAFFARIILGDVFTPWMILGTLLIAGGAVLIAFFGIVPEQTRSLEDLLELFRRPAFVAYFSVLAGVVVICLALTHVIEYSLSRRHDQLVSSPLNASTISLQLASEPNEQTSLLDPKPVSTPPLGDSPTDAYVDLHTLARTRILVAISYASFSGILSGMCLLFAKSGVELLLLTIKGNNQFWRWEAWMLILGLVSFALLQLWYLHKALVHADPTLVCPSAFCFYNLSSIVNGLVYFNQFSVIPLLHLFLVSVGIVVLLAGVWIISIQSETPIEDSASGTEDISEEEVAVSPVIGPLPMERATRSESSAIPNNAESSATVLPVGWERRAASHTFTQRRTLQKYPTHRATTPNIQLTTEGLLNNTLGAGFQIGLSPMSPGFEIVARKRRASMLTDEGSEVRGRRRVVSEGGGEGERVNIEADGQMGKGKHVPGRVHGWWRRRRC